MKTHTNTINIIKCTEIHKIQLICTLDFGKCKIYPFLTIFKENGSTINNYFVLLLHKNVNIPTAIYGMQWLCHNLKMCPMSWNFNKFQLLSGLRDGFQAQNWGDKLARMICCYHLCRFYSFGPDLYLEGMRSFSPFVFCIATGLYPYYEVKLLK